jgi:UTP:GlnB (protein PII) uridylyltransferase
MPLSPTAAEFVASMPSAYTNAFEESEAEEHARLVLGRGHEPALAVVWRSLPQGIAILCVVTDDRPGLVALVSAAFLAHALDVRAAQIYCRKCADGRLEAVDFFWLRNAPGGLPLDASRLDACARTIRELVAADSAKAKGEHARVSELLDAAEAPAKVSYVRDGTGADLWDVSLEARDFPGLLHTVARLLHQHGLEVVRCEIRTEDGLARDRFFVQAFNGAPAEPQLAAFRSALLGVISAIAKS